jgi:hypothetical protein
LRGAKGECSNLYGNTAFVIGNWGRLPLLSHKQT